MKIYDTSTENQLKKMIKLSAKLYEKTQNLVDQYRREKDFLKEIRQISNNFGLKFDIKFDVLIVSAEKKYLFNYLSGAFGNKDLQRGAKKLPEFIRDKRFTDTIQHLSARAISDKDIISKVTQSLDWLKRLGYPTDKGSFFFEMESLHKDISKKLKANKGVILIGVSSVEKLEPFDKLLAHELFHLVLISNDIWFQGIKEEYDYLDEGLAILLERRYSKRKKDIAAWFWEENLMLDKDTRIKKIKKLYSDLKREKTVS